MSISTHPVTPEEVMSFLDGELSADAAQSISTHLEECDECRETRDSVQKARQSLAKWIVPDVPQHMEDHVRRASVRLSRPSEGNFLGFLRIFLKRRPILALGGAAVAVLLLFDLSSTRYYKVASPRPMTKIEPSAPPPASAVITGHRSRGLYDLSPSVDTAKVLSSGDQGESSAERKPVWTPAAPMIARTVLLSIVVKDFDAGRGALDAILARHNGYAASLNVSTPQGAARALQASLRIPAPQLATALSELKALGRVEAENQNGEEVTQQHADLVARLKNSRETEQRLQDVLRTRTGKVKDVLEVEEEIARVRGEIEQMEGEQKALEHRVEFATIDLKLAEEYKAQLSTPAPSVWMHLRNATVNGFRNAFESLLGIVLFFAESGPTLLLWLAILGIPAWRLWRRYRRAQSLPLPSGSSM